MQKAKIHFICCFLFPLLTLTGQASEPCELYKLSEALAYAQKIDSLTPAKAACVAYALLEHKEWISAEKLFIHLEKKGGQDGLFYQRYAQLLLILNKAGKAIIPLKKSLEMGHDPIRNRHDLAAIYMQLRDWNKATEEYRTLLHLKPRNNQYVSLLGQCYMEKEEPVQALQLYEKQIPYLDSSVYARDILWDCARIAYYRLGDAPQSLQYLEKLTDEFPLFWEGWQELILVYHELGKFYSADRVRKRVAYAYEEKKLPKKWQKSGFWLVDQLEIEPFKLQVYERIPQSNEDEKLLYKVFIMDGENQHIWGKISVYSKENNADLVMEIQTSTREKTFFCTLSSPGDYSEIRHCMRESIESLRNR